MYEWNKLIQAVVDEIAGMPLRDCRRSPQI